MKEGRSLAELAQFLDRRRRAAEDYVVDSRQMTLLTPRPPMKPWSELSLPEGLGEFEVQPIAHRQIADRLRIPFKFYDRLRVEVPELLDENVNRLFRHEPERRMVRTLDWSRIDEGGERTARAYLSDRYRRLDDFDLAEAILPILQEAGAKVESAEVTDTRLHIKAVVHEVQEEVKPGDVVSAGVAIRNSEVGHGALSVQPLVYRLVCSNGMIVADRAVRRFHVGRQVDSDDALVAFRDETLRKDDEAFFAKIADVTRSALTEASFRVIVEGLREAADSERMEDPIEGVSRLAKTHDLGDREKGSVLQHLLQGGDLSAWGVANAVTRTAQDVEDYERATELETLGSAIVASAGTREWAAIASA